jgi:hypothetical protein
MQVDDYDPEQVVNLQEQELLKRTKDIDVAKQLLSERHRAYYHMFVAGEVTDADRAVVLKDLAKFCRKGTTTFDVNARIHALLSGRQEVIMRIDDYTDLSVEELFEKYVNPT